MRNNFLLDSGEVIDSCEINIIFALIFILWFHIDLFRPTVRNVQAYMRMQTVQRLTNRKTQVAERLTQKRRFFHTGHTNGAHPDASALIWAPDWTSDSNANMRHNNTVNLSMKSFENVTYYDNMTSTTNDTSLLIILLDRSQLIMTIVGVIANIGTAITLIKNGQVGMIITV